jgi:RNA polymerase sporulation-specific sigma factor
LRQFAEYTKHGVYGKIVTGVWPQNPLLVQRYSDGAATEGIFIAFVVFLYRQVLCLTGMRSMVMCPMPVVLHDLEKKKYKHMTDLEIATAAQNGDSKAAEYLLSKYRNLVRMRVKSYFLLGAEREDIVQEGMIGLYKAIRDYRGDKLTSFRSFADLCITRQIITAIKTATRQKNIPLNSAMSLDKPVFDDDSNRTLADLYLTETVCNPEEKYVNDEVMTQVKQKLKEALSELEWKVLLSYLDGKSYREMAEELNQGVKSVDNALFRIKRKVANKLCIKLNTK